MARHEPRHIHWRSGLPVLLSLLLISCTDPSSPDGDPTEPPTGSGAHVEFVSSRLTVYGLAYVGWKSEPVVADEQADTAAGPSGTLSASVEAAHDSAGHANAAATMTGSVTLDGDRFTGASGSGETNAGIEGTAGYPVGEGHGTFSIMFAVVDSVATVRFSGMVTAEADGEYAFAHMSLMRSELEPPHGFIEEIFRHTTNDPGGAIDTTLVLQPGRYTLNGNHRASVNCTECSATPAGSVSYDITVQ